MFSWSLQESQRNARVHAEVVLEHTIVNWYNFCREICELALLHSPQGPKIGGPRKIVEIDESKFGKRKFHRGRRVEGVWVFGGIEQGLHNVFLTCVPDRTRNTLEDIILRFILPETKVISDCWVAYNTESLERYGYIHETVNHSRHFRDPVTGAHTNTIEATWGAVKRSLPRYGTSKDLYATYFVEYIWRRKFITTPGTTLYVLCEHILEYHGFDPIDPDSDNDVD